MAAMAAGMSSIQERSALVKERRAAIEAHPMCAKLSEDRGYFYVTYPDGDFPVHGVRASKDGGKWAALGRLLIILERHWKESYPGATRT